MIWWALGALLVVGVLLAVHSLASKSTSKERPEPSYGANTPWQAGPRPLLYEGPSPATLLDRWKHFADHETLQWWTFEHLVAEFLRREGFEQVMVTEDDFEDQEVDIQALWQDQKVGVNVTHYGSDKWASGTEMRFFGRSIRLQGATAGYFITSGRISAKNLEAAPKMLPPVYALDGQRLWKAVQAQRGKKSTGLPKPS